MDDIKKYKNILVYGLGVTGLNVVKFLTNRNDISTIIHDDNPNKVLELCTKNNKVISLKNLKNLSFIDCIVLSPGIVINGNPIITKLKQKNVNIISDIELFYYFYPKKTIIAVTGTNGKTTLCTLLQEILSKNNYKSTLCGNIGKSIFSEESFINDILILEISSFQLDITNNINFYIGIIINISYDHLDRYIKFEKYVESKFRILQNKNTIAIVNNNALNHLEDSKKPNNDNLLKFIVNEKKAYYTKNETKYNILDQKKIFKLCSIHPELIVISYIVGALYNIPNKAIANVLENFSVVEHRLEMFTHHKNVNFINDSKATNFHSVDYALSKYNNVYWICGGRMKADDAMIKKIKLNNVIRIYIIGEAKSFMYDNFISKTKNIKTYESLVEAVLDAWHDIKNDAKQNSINSLNMLFSPGCASFDMWQNFNIRGSEFKKIVHNILMKKI